MSLTVSHLSQDCVSTVQGKNCLRQLKITTVLNTYGVLAHLEAGQMHNLFLFSPLTSEPSWVVVGGYELGTVPLVRSVPLNMYSVFSSRFAL
jgi:hypothetical protein